MEGIKLKVEKLKTQKKSKQVSKTERLKYDTIADCWEAC